MAINKTSNKSTLTHGAMRNCIEYVLKDEKITDRLIYMTGPAPDQINWDSVYQAFLEEKKIWNKDIGRMYNHNIISFHKDEPITPEQALEFGREFAEQWFQGHQTLVSIHQDRDHTHIHLVTNTVSFYDGKKLHNSKAELRQMKEFTNRMCEERGLSVARKGYHFDGTKIEQGEVIAWTKDKYQLMKDDSKKSYVADCGIAVMEAREISTSQEEFVREMEDRGWHTTWTENKKHITFENENGDKVRDTNLEKTFNMELSKEVLESEFERKREYGREKLRAEREAERAREEELEQYYAEVDAAIYGDGIDTEAGRSTADSDGTERPVAVRGETGGQETDTDAFIRSVEAERRNVKAAERSSVDAERERLLAEQQRLAGERAAEEAARRHIGFGR